MNSRIKVVSTVLSFAIGTAVAGADTNLVITSYREGYLSWTNVNPDLHYTVQWRPSLTGTNRWSGRYRGHQDLRSTNVTITVPVPMFYRVLASTTARHSRALSPDDSTVEAGYYAPTNLTQVDADLAAGNIAQGVAIFGVTGTFSGSATTPAPLPKTGQTTSYLTGDDGDVQEGVALPGPRFRDHGNGTVTDDLTGLMWTKDANISSQQGWTNATEYANSLNYGGHSDWRLPNLRELQSLMDYGNHGPALPSGHPFTDAGGTGRYYWTSTTYANKTSSAWYVATGGGRADRGAKTGSHYVWPVRTGQ